MISLKNFFATKYRIVPVYQDNTQCGFVVYQKRFFGLWEVAKISKLEKLKLENEHLIDHDAFFKTEDEAKNFIVSQKTIL